MAMASSCLAMFYHAIGRSRVEVAADRLRAQADIKTQAIRNNEPITAGGGAALTFLARTASRLMRWWFTGCMIPPLRNICPNGQLRSLILMIRTGQGGGRPGLPRHFWLRQSAHQRQLRNTPLSQLLPLRAALMAEHIRTDEQAIAFIVG